MVDAKLISVDTVWTRPEIWTRMIGFESHRPTSRTIFGLWHMQQCLLPNPYQKSKRLWSWPISLFLNQLLHNMKRHMCSNYSKYLYIHVIMIYHERNYVLRTVLIMNDTLCATMCARSVKFFAPFPNKTGWMFRGRRKVFFAGRGLGLRWLISRQAMGKNPKLLRANRLVSIAGIAWRLTCSNKCWNSLLKGRLQSRFNQQVWCFTVSHGWLA